MRVLLVEDSAPVRQAIAALLHTEPSIHVVGHAVDAESALREIDATVPDLVVLDVALAHGTRGYDVLLGLRGRHPSVVVVVLSNFGWQAMRSAFVEAGAQAYFDKSLEFGHAVEWIRRRARAAQAVHPVH